MPALAKFSSFSRCLVHATCLTILVVIQGRYLSCFVAFNFHNLLLYDKSYLASIKLLFCAVKASTGLFLRQKIASARAISCYRPPFWNHVFQSAIEHFLSLSCKSFVLMFDIFFTENLTLKGVEMSKMARHQWNRRVISRFV